MGYAQPPPPPPPPPPHQSSRNTMPMLYYGLVVLAMAGLVLALYNLIIIKWCSGPRRSVGPRRPAHLVDVAVVGNLVNFGQSIRGRSFLSSFKYEKGVSIREKGSEGEGEGEGECAVCLLVFEEGEEVRQLPPCLHCFHVDCIDMWLCSHSDCPICRSAVEGPPLSRLRSVPENDSERSREGLLVSDAAAIVVPNQ